MIAIYCGAFVISIAVILAIAHKKKICQRFYGRRMPKDTATLAAATCSLLYALLAIEKKLSYLKGVNIDCPEKQAYELARRSRHSVLRSLERAGNKIKKLHREGIR